MGKNNTKLEKSRRNEAYALRFKKKKRSSGARASALKALEPLLAGDLTGPRTSFQAVCSACAAPTTLPFEPVSGKPVYCRPCFQTMQRATGV